MFIRLLFETLCVLILLLNPAFGCGKITFTNKIGKYLNYLLSFIDCGREKHSTRPERGPEVSKLKYPWLVFIK